MSNVHKKIERLEQLISDNNELVARLSNSLLRRKAALVSLGEGGGGGGGGGEVRGGGEGGARGGRTNNELLPGCRLAEEIEGGANGVQVRRYSRTCTNTHAHTERHICFKLVRSTTV